MTLWWPTCKQDGCAARALFTRQLLDGSWLELCAADFWTWLVDRGEGFGLEWAALTGIQTEHVWL